jgi:hypothetical protein
MVKSNKSTPAPAVSSNPLEEAVARALRDNLAPLQRAVEELQHAYSDLTAACASARATNAIPAMLRAQAAAASLSAGLGVLTNFVTLALRPADRSSSAAQAAEMLASAAASATVAPAAKPEFDESEEEEAEEAAIEDEISEGSPLKAGTAVSETLVAAPVQAAPAHEPAHAPAAEHAHVEPAHVEPAHVEASHAPAAVEAQPEPEPALQAAPTFDVTTLAPELQELHRRAKRVAKVAMQDIKMLRPKDVRAARENRDICVRLKDDLDKARKEYDRRFKVLQDQPVDYFYDWLVAILADGDPEALGAYPYPSPVRR